MTTESRVRLARTLYTAADLFENDRRRYDNHWAAGSPADLETQNETYPGAWGDTPLHDAHRSVLLHVHAAAEHLRALGSGLEHSPAVIPLFTVARGVLDLATGPWYRLAPEIDSAARVKRFMNSELASQKALLNALGDLEETFPERERAEREAQQRMGAIIESAEKYGWRVVLPVRHRPFEPPHIHTGDGNGKPPSTTSLAKKILPAGGIGGMSWALHSGVAHGSAYALKMLTAEAEDGSWRVEQSDQQTALRYTFAPMAYLELLRRLYVRFGWKRTDHQALWEEIGRTWGEVSGITLPDPKPPLPATFRP